MVFLYLYFFFLFVGGQKKVQDGQDGQQSWKSIKIKMNSIKLNDMICGVVSFYYYMPEYVNLWRAPGYFDTHLKTVLLMKYVPL